MNLSFVTLQCYKYMSITYPLGSIFFIYICKWGSGKKWVFLTISQRIIREYWFTCWLWILLDRVPLCSLKVVLCSFENAPENILPLSGFAPEYNSSHAPSTGVAKPRLFAWFHVHREECFLYMFTSLGFNKISSCEMQVCLCIFISSCGSSQHHSKRCGS